MSSTHRPHRQLPPGVTRGLWQYAHSEQIAEDYDNYFSENTLFDLDQNMLDQYVQSGRWVVDLGCGTGRALVPLARRGLRGLAVDLSEKMLSIVREKSQIEHLPIQCVRANLVEMDFLAANCVDYAICLFSTLGMIRGRAPRQQMLEHTRRILNPGGLFVLHVHNYWFNLYDPGGPWWLLKNLLRAVFVRDIEPGDSFFTYRGVPNMFLHVFTLGELRRDLRHARFRIKRIIPLDSTRQRPLRWPWLFGQLRANGWILVCQ